MRPQAPHLHRQDSNGCHPSTSVQQSSSIYPEAIPPSMSISVVPSIPPIAPMHSTGPGRPKLSLQTSTLPLPFAHKSTTALSLSISTDSPTVRNTYANAFDVSSTSKPREVTGQPQPEEHTSPQSSSPSATSSTSSQTSPVSTTIPYSLPIGSRSILRNSPLPRRLTSATSARAPRRMFPPVKRVVFQESLVEIMPTPIIDESDASDSDSSTSSEKRRRVSTPEDDKRDDDEAEDMPSTPVQGRRKRRREWMWTLGPTDGDTPPRDIGKLSEDEGQNPNAEAGLISGKTSDEHIIVHEVVSKGQSNPQTGGPGERIGPKERSGNIETPANNETSNAVDRAGRSSPEEGPGIIDTRTNNDTAERAKVPTTSTNNTPSITHPDIDGGKLSHDTRPSQMTRRRDQG
ncbi:hypothetical protein MMC24_001198 [Lignoscripta atroalba]|nr:hypothetical protein [Lignoscripta atroalba]